MSTLPIDRTNLNLAIVNQVPSAVIQSAKNINAISTLYDGSDAIYNYVLAAFAAYTAAGGAASIGTSAITGLTSANVQAMLAEIEAQVQAIVAGSVPTGSITTTMIQNLAVTSAKIADGTITATKLATDIQAKINQIYSNEREIANLKAQSAVANRVDGASGIFYDLNDGLNGGSAGKIDNTKTNSTGTIPISAGTIVVPVLATTGFTVGQEVTIFDDVSLERRIVTAINAGVSLSFAAMTNSYKIKAQICRSSVIQDTVNHLLKFGGWSYLTTYTNTAVSVVALAYDTSGNNGNKLVITANGNWIAIEVNGTTVQVQKSIDNGVSYQALCNITGMQVGAAIAWNGGNSVTVICNTTTVVYSVTFDVTTVTNIDLNSTKVIVDNGCTSIANNMSIKTGSDGIPQGSWSGITAALPNSKNVRYSKATTTAVTAWATPTQITTNNTAGLDQNNPCVVVRSNNYPIVIFSQSTTSNNGVFCNNWNGSVWSAANVVYAGSTYTQSNPCALVKQNGANIGRIICRWQGWDSTDTTHYNERWAYSDDVGATWTVVGKITSGNTVDRKNGSLSEDNSGNIFDTYMDGTSVVYQNCPNGTTTFGTLTTMNATGSNPSSIERMNFTIPPTVYMSGSSVLFNGTFISAGITPVLVEDVRYNINPPANVSSAVAWVDHDADANYSIAGAVSFQTGGGTESFSAMTKTTAAIDGTHNEDQFTGSGTSAAKSTLRLTLTRNSTSLVKNISQITGAVGA